MSSYYGQNIHISIFGESHSPGIGVVIDGLPSGHKINMDQLQDFLKRRAPGNHRHTTHRKEEDIPEILSGLKDGYTTGSPLSAIIRNTGTRPTDYGNLKHFPRPGHADYTAYAKFGEFTADSGGGHFSGRLTAPLCIAGGIILQILEEKGIFIGAHISEIGGIKDMDFNPVNITKDQLQSLKEKDFPVIDDQKGQEIIEAILSAHSQGDSLGGIIECSCIGLPPGIGEPMFQGLENKIAGAIFGIPGVKGIEFGSGFNGSRLTGSQNNDPFIIKNGEVKTLTNNHGGILGGISSGMPLIFRSALKPTSSISIPQKTVNLLEKTEAEISVKGRHDPCIVSRAVPCVEAAAAIAIYDVGWKEL